MHRFCLLTSVGQQIDLVPTLALLLDVPIPFGNLGSVIPEFFLHSHNQSRDAVALSAWQTLNGAYHINAGQVWHYLVTYTTMSNIFAADRLQQLKATLDEATELFWTAETSDEQHRVAKLYQSFLSDALAMCRQLWSTGHIE